MRLVGRVDARRTTSASNLRSGFTVIEFMVTVSVLAALMAILVPAVQSARGSARAVVCKNNFRQMTIALQQYTSLHRQFPRTRMNAKSSFVQLLPWLEHASLYAMLTGEADSLDRDAVKHPGVFRCAEDPVSAALGYGTNIGENIGICVGQERFKGRLNHIYNGVFIDAHDPGRVTPDSITDGLSNTVCYSEILAYPRPGYSRRIYTHMEDSLRVSPVEELAKSCRSAKVGMAVWAVPRGSDWIGGMVQVNQYMHVLPPNERDCLFIPGAASEHKGGVHVAVCDGSVKFVSSSVDEIVWRAMGSRDTKDGPVEW